jgi:chemotaxis protein MotA
MAKIADEEHAYYHVLRVLLVGLLKGINPGVAIEIGRRAIPSHLRPSFQEAETYIKEKAPEAAADAPAADPAAEPATPAT